MIKRGIKNSKKATRALTLNKYKIILKSKRSTRILTLDRDKIILKSKRSQQLFGMPFAVIFSIILIVIFLFVAFFAITIVLGWMKCINSGNFIEDLQDEIDRIWATDSFTPIDEAFSRTLPDGIEYVCIADLSKEPTGSAKEKEIYVQLKRNANYESNLFFFPPKNVCAEVSSAKIGHISTPDTNPYCFEAVDGKVNVKIERGYRDSLIKISRA